MKLKRSFILFFVVFIFSLTGCGKSSPKQDLKKDILGAWNAGANYMVFFENGNVGMFSTDSGKSDIMPYEVEGTTVIISHPKTKTTLKLLSAEVKNNTLTYTSEQGNKNSWQSVPLEEAQKALEKLTN